MKGLFLWESSPPPKSSSPASIFFEEDVRSLSWPSSRTWDQLADKKPEEGLSWKGNDKKRNEVSGSFVCRQENGQKEGLSPFLRSLKESVSEEKWQKFSHALKRFDTTFALCV